MPAFYIQYLFLQAIY